MPNVIVSIKAVIWNNDQFLILKQTRPTLYYWDLPGGKLEYGETPELALVREVKEETGLDISPKAYVGLWWFFSPTHKHQVVCPTFVAELAKGSMDLVNILDNPADEHIKGYAWVTKYEFLNGDYPVLNDSLGDMIGRL